MAITPYLDFTLSQTQGDTYVTLHGLTVPRPIDLKIIPPHYVGRDIGGKPYYQGYYALEAHFNWKSWAQLEALFAYYIPGHLDDNSNTTTANDEPAKVGVRFFDPYVGSYVTMQGWMHEPQVSKAQVHLYMDVIVRFSHLITVNVVT